MGLSMRTWNYWGLDLNSLWESAGEMRNWWKLMQWLTNWNIMTVLDSGKKSIHTTAKKAPLSNNIDGCFGPSDIEMWRGHFQDIFNNVSNLTDKQYVKDRINCISAHHITTPGDIEEALNDLNLVNVQGLTTFKQSTWRMLQMYSMFYYLYCARLWWSRDIKNIVNTILETVIIPVIKNKSGDATDKHNYRTIAISTTMSKVLELLMLHQTLHWGWLLAFELVSLPPEHRNTQRDRDTKQIIHRSYQGDRPYKAIEM